jgi:hypothetical protein
MGADFSEFHAVIIFALQILTLVNLKGFKMQLTKRSQHQNHMEKMEWNYSVPHAKNQKQFSMNKNCKF